MRWRSGPLARYILGYAHALQGNKYSQRVKEQIESSAVAINSAIPKALGLPETQFTAKQLLPTTIGRTLARALESQYCGEMMQDDFNELVANIKAGDTSTANVEKWDPSTWPKEAKGVGTVAAPRGALGHWIRIKDGRIENYQCVVPTTWNGSPRDTKGQIGAFEASLMNTPMVKPRAAGGDPAHAAFVRPVPGLFHPRDQPGRHRAHDRQGALMSRAPTQDLLETHRMSTTLRRLAAATVLLALAGTASAHTGPRHARLLHRPGAPAGRRPPAGDAGRRAVVGVCAAGAAHLARAGHLHGRVGGQRGAGRQRPCAAGIEQAIAATRRGLRVDAAGCHPPACRPRWAWRRSRSRRRCTCLAHGAEAPRERWLCRVMRPASCWPRRCCTPVASAWACWRAAPATARLPAGRLRRRDGRGPAAAGCVPDATR